jgi:hypothetical protein
MDQYRFDDLFSEFGPIKFAGSLAGRGLSRVM